MVVHEPGDTLVRSDQRQNQVDQSIYALFEARAQVDPAAPAILDGTTVWKYGELRAQADALARKLDHIGIECGERVAVIMSRSSDMIVAQLAIVAVGAVYVPIDPDWPTERRRYVIADAKVRHVLTASDGDYELNGVTCLNVRSLPKIAKETVSAARSINEAAPAYMMYTSGSTGAPKGVLVSHSAISNLALNNIFANIRSADRVANVSNPAFDASTFEVWGALLNGAQIVIVPKEVLIDLALLSQFLRESGINVMFLTTALFNHYASVEPGLFRGLRYLLTGGEACNAAAAHRVLMESTPECLLNMYGPTEATTFSTYWQIDGEERATIPIGYPISNAQVHILDANLRAAPDGEFGEIYIGGDGIAMGYQNKPSLTAQRFVADPYSSASGARLYKTGDIGKRRSDGALEYLGRNDRQVKIRGFRIELDEIEKVLNGHEFVAQSVVVCRKDRCDRNQLICYVTMTEAARIGSDLQLRQRNAQAIRIYMHERLPDYMIPQQIVMLEQFPFTSSGKIDRQVIQAWEFPEQDLRDASTEARTPLEKLLTEVWVDVLGLRRLGIDDDFFESGGDSIMAAKIVSELGRRGELRAMTWMLFQHPTIREFADAIQGDSVKRASVGMTERSM